MIYRKKLIEVALPLEAINVASAREKSIRHGHPSTLHLWWARRPLAACRAVLFASLVDDPDSDPTFRKADGSVDEERAGYRRAELFNLIEELVKWENSNNESVLNRACAEIAASVASRKILDTEEWKKDQIICSEKAWEFVKRTAKPTNVNAFLAEHAPPVLDPFCGGGSIPLEAQRLGLRAYASDLNPVPVLITKALIEIPPKFAGKPPVNPELGKQGTTQNLWNGAQGLVEDIRYYGNWMRDEAKKRIGHLYPKVKITAALAEDRPDLKPYVGEALTVIAWLWARTIASPNPAVGGAHVPLVRSFWLSSKRGTKAYIEPVIDRMQNKYEFVIRIGMPPQSFDPKKGTVVRTGATCLLSGSPIPFDYIRKEGKAGRMSSRLMAIVAEGTRGRVYLPASDEQADIAASARPSDYPDTDLPKQALSMRVMLYGMDKHYKLFTQRQLVGLVTFSDLVGEARDKVFKDAVAADTLPRDEDSLEDRGGGARAYADAIATYLGFLVDQLSNQGSTLTGWYAGNQQLMMTFSRQALAMVWDYAESNPLCQSTGSYHNMFERLLWAFENIPAEGFGFVDQADASAKLIAPSNCLIATDPPYYDNIGYSDLSDYFYAWLRRSLSKVHPKLLSTLLTPKTQELIATPFRHNGNKEAAKAFFERGLSRVFERMRRENTSELPLVIFYAFKQSEDEEGPDDDGEDSGAGSVATASTGWETILTALINAGFVLTGTWPMRTESNRGLKSEVNALASSVILTCSRRAESAPLATRREFLNALKQELPDALKHLQRGNIAPVDLAQAAIGPGMAVFTRYAKVMESSGEPMKVRQALALINQTLDEVLAEQEGDFDGDTRWALAWFEQYSMEDGPYGVAETLSKAKNTAVNALVEAGIVQARSGKVKLLKREELDPKWDPTTDTRLTAWEITQYLILMLEKQGEQAAADLLRKLGGTGEVARDLAYRLYNLCERKKWPQEALSYNALVIAWPEISRLARAAAKPAARETQEQMF